jgi:NAD(P)H-hydrate epimerase
MGDRFQAELLRDCLSGADWVLDALLGTGATGEPRSPYREVIDAVNASPARKLAVDLPSGLDCDTGRPAATTFRADHTCTFVAPKPGFFVEAAKPYVGQIHVLDIGAPRKLMESLQAGSEESESRRGAEPQRGT